MRKVLIIDGQGGQLGGQLIRAILNRFPHLDITAVGTNAIATAAMLKAGAQRAATGENPVVVACRQAEVIIGPIGIVIADALMGEITPRMAAAIGQASAVRILIPMNKCENIVAGVSDLSMTALIRDTVERLEHMIESKESQPIDKTPPV